MSLEITIKDPRDREKTIQACLRFRSLEIDIDHGGQIRFDVWRSQEVRDRVKNDQNDMSRPLPDLFVVSVGKDDFILPDEKIIASIKLLDILDRDKNIIMSNIYSKIKQYKIRYNGEVIDLKDSKDVE